MSNEDQDQAVKRRRTDPENQQAAPDNRHSDWGHSQAGDQSSVQSNMPSSAQVGGAGNIGGVPGTQHNDWGHSAVTGGARRQSENDGNVAGTDEETLPRQGIVPGGEMG